MRSHTNVPKHPTNSQSYSPSVPLSIYRELAAELQVTQTKLNSLNAQNQQLAKQNQQLRQEIEKVVQHVLHLQQVVESTGVNRVDDHPERVVKTKPSHPVSSPHPMSQGFPSVAVSTSAFPAGAFGSSASQQAYIEQVEVDSYRRSSPPERTSEVSGWRLAIAILVVTATAFSAGYLLVRPLMSSR